MLLPSEPTSSANWALVLVPESGKLPATHQVADSPKAPSTAGPLPALKSSNNFVTTFLFSSTPMVLRLRQWQRDCSGTLQPSRRSAHTPVSESFGTRLSA